MAAFLCGMSCMQAATYFSCGFENGIPEEMSVFDKDSQTMHFTMVQLGFGDKDSWITMLEEGTENHYAASGSRFKTAKGEDPVPAEDWLVTPAVWVRADDAKLTWRGMSVNDRNSKTSTYEVRVSADGPSPEQFTSEPVAVIGSEKIYEWTTHEVDLGAYVGKRVYIAFVNRSLESDVLALDDINVEGSSGLASLEILPGEYTLGDEELSFGGILTASSDEIVNTLSISFFVGDEEFHASYENLGLKEGESYDFMLPEKVSANYGEVVPFTVSAEVNGVPFDDMNLHTTLLAFLPKKRVVVEEATGMWCGYCPEGIVAMETLQERYPDEFIGIAVHVNDDVTVPGYGDVMSFPSGAPTAWIDRRDYCKSPLVSVTEGGVHTYTTLMGGIESVFISRLAEQAFADVDVSSALNDNEDEMELVVKVRFAKRYNDSDFRVVLVMTEDDVWKQGYYQTNYHSGRDEVLGGFESLPPVITDDFSFSHVARWIGGSYTGIEGIFPADIEAGEEYRYSSTVKLPKSVVDTDNLKMIAMVADASTGEIMNAAACGISHTGISEIDDSGITIHGGDGVISAAGDGQIGIVLHDVSGKLVGRASGRRCATVGNLPSGVYIVNACVDGMRVRTAKIVI